MRTQLYPVVKVESLDEPVAIHAISDWHVGAYGCAEDQLRKDIAKAASNPKALFLLPGDLADLININDKRFDALSLEAGAPIHRLADWGDYIETKLFDIAAPMVGRCIGVLEGNHEISWNKRAQHNVTNKLAAFLHAPNLGYDSLWRLRITDGAKTEDFLIRTAHGAGAAASLGGKINRLAAYADATDADLTVIGHLHEYLTVSRTRLSLDGRGKITAADSLAVCCGAYLRTYAAGPAGYGEVKGYRPTALGHAQIEVIARGRQIASRRFLSLA